MAASPSREYEHIFFDLDHTLWDFEGNSRKTLTELFVQLNLSDLGIPDASKFITEYEKLNHWMWAEYRAGRMDKPTLRNTRFKRVFKLWDVVHDSLADELNELYLTEGPKKTGLLPNALETLDYLMDRYDVHLITNGFKEVQHTKLSGSRLLPYFKTITTSEETGFLKPDRRVFDIALETSGAHSHHSLYVGDHYETDVIGSRNAGIDQVHFNPEGIEVEHPATFEIRDLAELMEIL